MFATEVRVEELASERLEAELTTLAAHLHAGTCRFLLMVAEFDRRGLYESWGCRGTSQWLSWKCAISKRTAREHVHVARALEKLPQAAAAFGRGELSYAKVRAMARVAGVVDEDELMNLATAATAAQLERILGTFAHHYKRQTTEPEQRERFSAWWDDDGMLHYSGAAGPEDGALLLAAMATKRKQRQAAERAAKKQAAEDEAGGESGSAEPLSEPPTLDDFDPAVSRRRSAQDFMDVIRDAVGISDVHGPPVEVLVHADLELFLGMTDEGRAWIDGGPALSAEVLRRLGCDASWRLIIENRDRNPLYVGRKTKDPNIFQRMAIWSRSGGRCEIPNCSQPMRHIHHVWWWSKGGPTDIDQLIGVCTYDHTLIHQEQLTVTALGQQHFAFKTAGGRPITPADDLRPVEGTLEDHNAAAGVHCDPTTCSSTGENEPFDLRYVVDTIFANLNL